MEEFDRTFDVDVRGMWLLSPAFVNTLIDNAPSDAEPMAVTLGSMFSQPAIVNASSVHSRATMGQYAIYAAAKAAVDGFTRGCAVELGRLGVRCNGIAPGYVHSEQNAALLAKVTSDPIGWVKRHRIVEQPLQRPVEPIVRLVGDVPPVRKEPVHHGPDDLGRLRANLDYSRDSGMRLPVSA